MISLILLKKIVSLLIIVLFGFMTVKLKLAPASSSRLLSILNIYFITPCVIINAFQADFTPQIRNGLLLALAAAVLAYCILLAGNAVFKRVFHLSPVEQLTSVYTNCGNLLIPIVLSMLGSEYIIYTSMYMCVQTVFIWTHGISTIRGGGVNLKKIVTNINFISILVGIAFLALHIQLPTILTDTMSAMTDTAGPLAMLVIGMLMAEMDLKEYLKRYRFWLTLFLRLIVTSLLCVLMLRWLRTAFPIADADNILFVSMLGMTAPAAVIVTQLAQLYGGDEKYAGALMIGSTLLCAITMPVMAWVYYL